jgi:biopolymer transport protein TolR
MALSQRSGPRVALAEINVTPLVDVMLVLLIIFMVTAPVLTRKISIELPSAQSSTPIQDDRPVTVTVERNGQFRVDGTAVFDQRLIEEVKRRGGGKTGTTVFIEADGKVAYERVLQAMDSLRTGGIVSVSLVTVPKRNPDSAREN